MFFTPWHAPISSPLLLELFTFCAAPTGGLAQRDGGRGSVVAAEIARCHFFRIKQTVFFSGCWSIRQWFCVAPLKTRRSKGQATGLGYRRFKRSLDPTLAHDTLRTLSGASLNLMRQTLQFKSDRCKLVLLSSPLRISCPHYRPPQVY